MTETVLQGEREDVIDFATDGGSFAAIKVAEFLESVRKVGNRGSSLRQDSILPNCDPSAANGNSPTISGR